MGQTKIERRTVNSSHEAESTQVSLFARGGGALLCFHVIPFLFVWFALLFVSGGLTTSRSWKESGGGARMGCLALLFGGSLSIPAPELLTWNL